MALQGSLFSWITLWNMCHTNDWTDVTKHGILFSWKTSWLLFHAMNKGRVANFYGQASDAYAYDWTVQCSLFSWITLWNLCPTLDRCKVAYIHGKLHDFCPMQWRNYADYESTSVCLYSFTPCANIHFIVFGLIKSLIETTIYRTWCEYS